MMNIFKKKDNSVGELASSEVDIQNRINQLNAKRASIVLATGIFMELFLISVFDIPSIIQNGISDNNVYYLLLHIILLMVSLVGTLASRNLLYKEPKWILKSIGYDNMLWIASTIFIASIAFINGLDQVNSDDTTLYVFFILVISLFVLLRPKKMLIVLGVSYISFVIGQLLFQADQAVLFSNITNGTLAVIVGFFMAYYSYNNYVDHVFTTIRLEETTTQLEILSVTDQLTKVYNRRKFDENIEVEIARSKRTNIPFSLLMLDIDHFKKVNDNYGHQAGDEILIGVSNFISKQVRVEDTFARYGGEEFVLILTNTTVDKALEKANFICEKIREETFYKDVLITISIGVTEFLSTDSHDDIVNRSDNALYEAKEFGRDQVVVK